MDREWVWHRKGVHGGQADLGYLFLSMRPWMSHYPPKRPRVLTCKVKQQRWPSGECQEKRRKELPCAYHSAWHTVGADDYSWYHSQELRCEGRS